MRNWRRCTGLLVCGATMALRVPRYRWSNGGAYIGPYECIGDPWCLEPDPQALADALRCVRDHPEQMSERSEAARAFVRTDGTWERAAAEARERLRALVG